MRQSSGSRESSSKKLRRFKSTSWVPWAAPGDRRRNRRRSVTNRVISSLSPNRQRRFQISSHNSHSNLQKTRKRQLRIKRNKKSRNSRRRKRLIRNRKSKMRLSKSRSKKQKKPRLEKKRGRNKKRRRRSSHSPHFSLRQGPTISASTVLISIKALASLKAPKRIEQGRENSKTSKPKNSKSQKRKTQGGK